ncbi:OmpA family protein [Roseibacillus persicicus]|uniref:OmpA family protein n=1 Tax=Roseibacillus persicicus TaxID=454148 RepID=UPI00398A6453
MKKVFLLLAGANLAFGQSTVLTCFDDGHEQPMIGIVPVEDYQKATAEIDKLRVELDEALRGKAAARLENANAKGAGKTVQELRNQLKTAHQEMAKTLQKERGSFAEREKAMVAKVNQMEKERAKSTQEFQKRLAVLQADFGKRQGEWERKLMVAEEARDAAIRKLEESELIRVRDNEAWQKSVKAWQKETENAVRSAQMKEAQDAVANTARLAAEWEEERTRLQGEIRDVEQAVATQTAAWEESVAAWQSKTEKAVRAAQIKEAQAAVANTARLAKSWQSERDELEAQVAEMSKKLAELEGELGVKGFESKQTEVLRLGLTQKTKALEELGSDAARLAMEWRKEREDSRRELDAMRDLYQSTNKDVKTRDQRVRQLESRLSEKNQVLNALATEAENLSKSWQNQRGGLQKKIKGLEKKLADCQKQLEKSVGKDKKEDERLAEQLRLAKELQGKLGLAKKREDELKTGLGKLKSEFANLKKEVGTYQSQKEQDAKALAALKEELKQSKEQHAAAQQELAETSKNLVAARKESEGLKSKASELEGLLLQARKDLEVARKAAAENQKAQARAAEKELQVKNLEQQLGRLAVAQQELEGTLIATLGDFEKLQKSYLELKAKSADGGEEAQKAMVARDAAEAELEVLQKKLQAEEAKLEQARKRVQQVEKERQAAEAKAKADAEAGKAALGKSEAELQNARRELGKLQLGQEMLVKEAEALRERFIEIQPVRYQLASANVVAQQQRVLSEARQVLEVYPDAKFSIKGHTCNLGSKEGNMKLSEDRALGLRDFLVENGIEEERFTLVLGCGDSEPQASNDTDEGRQQNRRVEIKVLK